LLRVTNQLNLSTRLWKHWVFKTQNDHLYQTIFGRKADSDLNSQNYLYFHPENKVYPYAIGFVSTNFRRNIHFREFAGLGLTYQILQKPLHSLKLSGNVLHEQTRYSSQLYNYTEFDGSNEIKAVWGTVYLSGLHSFNNPGMKVYYELYWQQSTADQVNYRYHFLTGIDFHLVKALAIQSRIIYSHENVIDTAVKQNDLLWVWGLTYGFKSRGLE
jgi:hypothetical protein